MGLCRKRFIVAVFLATTLFSTGGLGAAPFSLDDLLKMEGFGHASFHPSGDWLFFERIPPYETLSDYSFRTYAQRFSGNQIWRVSLDGNYEPERLPRLSADDTHYIESFSPDGRFLSIYQYSRGKFSLGAYDLKRNRFMEFKETPAFVRTGKYRPAWVSNETYIYPALEDGDQPDATSIRTSAAAKISKAWQDAWEGDVPTAQVFHSSDTKSSVSMHSGHLIEADARTGKTKKLAEGLFSDLQVSPDGSAVATFVESNIVYGKAAERSPSYSSRHILKILDFSGTEKITTVPDIEFMPGTLIWDRQGRRVAAFGWRNDEGFQSGRYYAVDSETGAVRAFEHAGLDLASQFERTGFYIPERAHFLGDGLAVFARPFSDLETSLSTFSIGNEQPSNDAPPNWYLISPDGKVTPLTQGLENVSDVALETPHGELVIAANSGIFAVDDEGAWRRVSPITSTTPVRAFPSRYGKLLDAPGFTEQTSAVFTATIDHRQKAILVDLSNLEGRSSETMDIPDERTVLLAGSRKASAALFRRERGGASQLLLTGSATPSAPIEIAHINDHLLNRDYGHWKIIEYKVTDPETGRVEELTSCVLLPSDFDSSNPPPLLVDVYPNRGPQCLSDQPKIEFPLPHSPYLWSARGYAYAPLSAPRDLIHTNDGPIDGIDEVLEAGISALVDSGLANPNQIVLQGNSQGGVTALFAAAHSEIFKGVIALHSWADLFSHYFGGAGIYSYAFGKALGGNAIRYETEFPSDFSIGVNPFERPDLYYKNSPVWLAPNIDVPVLLINTDMDAFSMSQFDEMFGALRLADKQATYIRYLGEGHTLSSPANIRDMWNRIDEFLMHLDASPQDLQQPPKIEDGR